MKYLLVASIILIAYGCGNTKTEDVAYLGGEIVNPNHTHVILYKNDKVIDSAVLDDRNRFLIKINAVEEGLYHFAHNPEMQYVMIEKGDSILFRLNTLDFDESLIFTGRGAEKNNFMIDMYLMNEDEERLVYDYYDLEVDEFVLKMDSLKAMKLEQYNNLIENFEISDHAKQIVKASIDYKHYDAKEIYPYLHNRKIAHNKIDNVPDDYYDYRNALNYNDTNLSYFGPYVNYLNTFFNNLAYAECMKMCEGAKLTGNKTLHFHLHKLRLIDGKITCKHIRDNLYRNTAFAYFRKDHNPINNEKFIDSFNKYSKDNKYSKEIIEVFTAIKKLKQGSSLPQVALVTTKGTEVKINALNYRKHKNTVYYFWSLNQRKHMKNINRKVNELRKKHPEYAFVGISINEDHNSWLNAVSKMNLDPSYQFRCEDFIEVRNQLVIEGLNKVIIVKEDGTIVNAFGDIFEPNFALNIEKQKSL